MKKVMSIVFAALMIAGATAVYAGDCASCPAKTGDKKECSSEKKACSGEKKECAKKECPADKA